MRACSRAANTANESKSLAVQNGVKHTIHTMQKTAKPTKLSVFYVFLLSHSQNNDYATNSAFT